MPSKVKTKFPMARLKKIMQSDEEVGKIGAEVPVMMSKCLELFIADLASKTAEITQERESKTMTALHLKECINKEKQFDFLQDIVENIQEIESKNE